MKHECYQKIRDEFHLYNRTKRKRKKLGLIWNIHQIWFIIRFVFFMFHFIFFKVLCFAFLSLTVYKFSPIFIESTDPWTLIILFFDDLWQTIGSNKSFHRAHKPINFIEISYNELKLFCLSLTRIYINFKRQKIKKIKIFVKWLPKLSIKHKNYFLIFFVVS